MKKSISEIVCHAAGSDEPVYRALRPLICAACGGEIPEGGYFTRRALGGIRLLPQCQKCVPFSLETTDEKPSLLRTLLSSQTEATDTGKPVLADNHADEIREAVAARLGPALKRTHRHSKTKWRSKR